MRVAMIFAVLLLLLSSGMTACSGSGNDKTPTNTPGTVPDPVPTLTDTPIPPVPSATATATVTPEPTVPALEDQVDRILGLIPVKPTNINLFTSDYRAQPVYPEAYPDGTLMEPATGSPSTTEAIRAELGDFLTAAFGAEASETVSTMALFDDPAIAERVPEARLRAAFVLINVTIAAPLIDTYMNSGIYGGTLDWIETGWAFTETSRPGPDGKQLIGVSNRYQYEHFALITPNIVHSMLHHDGTFSYPEDVVILTIATVSYLQLVEMHPEIAYAGTELSRFNNMFALALLNSHAAGSSEIRLIVPSGASVLPGSPNDAPDFWTMIAAGDSPSPAPDVVRAILKAMLVPGTAISSPLRFDRGLAELISGNIDPDVLSPDERLRASVLLTMISTDEVAALLGRTREETIEALNLSPIESIRADHP
ncbi:MAG: hypothetical protein R3A46_13930 [Thermomicrobiales bacterium]